MKKFIIRILLFLLPVIALEVFTYTFYDTARGDLLRVGYIINLYPDYRNSFERYTGAEIAYTQMSAMPQQGNYDVITIGDSYSEQGSFGYQNILSNRGNVNILHIDEFLQGQGKNPLQALYGLLNGNFFDHYSSKYLVLEMGERTIVKNALETDTKKIINLSQMEQILQSYTPPSGPDYSFPSDRSLKFTYNAFYYLLTGDRSFNNKVGRAQLNQDLFSTTNRQLLYSLRDIFALRWNNDPEKVQKLNYILNDLSSRLSNRGIKLIVLPGPDKYNVYYDYLQHQDEYPKPEFQNIMRTLPKNYIYIDSHQILKDALPQQKDIYFYDDTHWSPAGSELIAKSLLRKLNEPQ